MVFGYQVIPRAWLSTSLSRQKAARSKVTCFFRDWANQLANQGDFKKVQKSEQELDLYPTLSSFIKNVTLNLDFHTFNGKPTESK